ncbi:MAG: RagB/SusD family nutrient uptake outer membrane protein [Bacteroidota bacterium]
MRKYFTLFLLPLLFSLIGCSGFLDREPLDEIVSDNFYRTPSEVNSALLSAYVALQDLDWYGKAWMMLEVPSDNSQPGGTDPEFSPIDNFTMNGDTPPVATFWATRYRLITFSNIILSKIPNSELDEVQSNVFSAEARFLRGLAYFDLVRIYGGVPLITTPPVQGENMLFERDLANDVYAFIKEDLAFAVDHLPLRRGGENLGRATKGSAAALLAKVHLTRREYGQSRDRAKQVIDSGEYALMADYADNWRLETADNNSEAIFQVQYSGCGAFGTGNAMQAFFAPWGEGITKDRDGWGSQIPTSPVNNNPGTTISDAFEDNDLRKDPTIMTPNTHYPEINAIDGGYTYPSNGASASMTNIKKYVVGSGGNICFMSTPMNAHLIRYADVLLIYAESLMEIQGGETANAEALQYFNEVRARAGLEDLAFINREIMLEERRLEFAFENQRWFDLVRTGKAVELLTLHGKNIQNHHVLFPLPSAELETNPLLTQNPGY